MANVAMTNSDAAPTASKLLFVATICVGSFLLFLVQPMMARMALPRLGGAPAVWNSAMLVYQALLLGGYAYAHWLGRFVPRTQSIVHIAGFALAALMLPIGLIASNPPEGASPFIWVPWLFLVSIGPLFFMISAQAPLMQRWFSLSGGANPYPLYAASNLGSFAGLLAYPLIVEPLLPIAQQRLLWSIGYAVVLIMIALCALKLPKNIIDSHASHQNIASPSAKIFGYWILLAAVPSGLMLSTSLHLTTDIVAMPLLWVFPLGLYLLSFSVAFAQNQALARFICRLAPFILLIATACAFVPTAQATYVYAAIGLLMLFTVSVALHSEMFVRRPDPQHLTRFYLAMSIGGVVGGLFCALLAPLIFNWAYEYPLLLAISGLLVAAKPLLGLHIWDAADTKGRRSLALITVLIILVLVSTGTVIKPIPDFIRAIAVFTIFAIAIFTLGTRGLFTACLVALMLVNGGWERLSLSIQPGIMTRSFFGIYTVKTDNKGTRSIAHGTTLHGVQMQGSDEQERTPTTYYGRKSGIGIALAAAPALFGPQARIAAIGLGAGTLACYAQPGQNWRFYEIDPAVAVIARDPKRFTFLSKCLPDVPIIIGDARLMMARAPVAGSDIIVVDAFSSDSVPMHLLTREAFATYERHLAPGGILMIHVSNRYLALEPVLAAAAKGTWFTKVRDYRTSEEDRKTRVTDSIWVMFTKKAQTLRAIEASAPDLRWRAIDERKGFVPWTDDYGSILSILKTQNRD